MSRPTWTTVATGGMVLCASAAIGEAAFHQVTGRGSQTFATVAAGLVLAWWFLWLVAGGAEEPVSATSRRRRTTGMLGYALLAVAGCSLLARGVGASERAGLIVWVVAGIVGGAVQWRRMRTERPLR